MKLFLDTNVFVEFIEHRKQYESVSHELHGGLVVGILAQIEKFAQTEVGRQPGVIELCVFH